VGGSYSDDGVAPTITFPAPTDPAPAAGPTISRSAAPPPLRLVASPAATSRPARAPEIDLDEIYEQVAARLRHELLLDRERVGDLLGGLTGRPPR
jgi:hypothetical protein